MTIEKERELGTCTSCKARGRIWSSKTADAYPYDTEKLCKKCSQPKILTKAFEKAWDIVKEDNPVSVSVGHETIEVSCMIDGERKRKRYSGYSKKEAEQKFRQEFGC